MTDTTILQLAALEQYSSKVPLIPGLRRECHCLSHPGEKCYLCYQYQMSSVIANLHSQDCAEEGCQGRSWLPVDEKEAAWVLMGHDGFDQLTQEDNEEYLCVWAGKSITVGKADTPWQAVINAAAKALLPEE